MNNKTIIDVTYLAHWSGKLTGIPRVIDELARRYSGNPDTVFVIWDERMMKYFQTDFAEMLNVRGRKIHYSLRRGGKNRAVSTVARYLGFGTFYRILNKVGTKFHAPIFNSIARVCINVRYAANQTLEISKRDILFIPMGIWHSEGYINMVNSMKSSGVKIAQISYDMLPIVTPQYSNHSTEPMLDYTERTFPVSDVIFSISEHTKRDIEQWLKSQKLDVPDIQVFRLGDDFKKIKVNDLKRFENSSTIKKKQYILCVGTIELRKNHAILYYVYRIAAARGITLPPLVVVGRKGWQGDGVYDLMTKDPEVNKHISVLTDTSDEELSWLYKNAKYTIYPSFYEGWGLPVAESISYGVPVLASNTSSIPEIAGDLIEYFDPISAEDVLSKIQYMENAQNLKDSIKKVGRYQQTTWDDTFRQINRGLEGLHEKN